MFFAINNRETELKINRAILMIIISINILRKTKTPILVIKNDTLDKSNLYGSCFPPPEGVRTSMYVSVSPVGSAAHWLRS